MRALLVMLMAVSFGVAVHAQPQPPEVEWSRTYGRPWDDYCESVRQTSDGGYLLAGFTTREDGEDFWLVRTNALGDSLWSRTYGGTGLLECRDMQLTSDGGCVMAGGALLSVATGFDFWVVKTDAAGDSQWSRSFGGPNDDFCEAVLQADDGGHVLAGSTHSYGAGGYDFWLVKTDSVGDSLWSRTFGGYADDECACVERTADGGYILGGGTWSYGAGWYDIWLVKTDANGDSQWSRTIGGSGMEFCYSLQRTADGGFILAGEKYEPTDSSGTDALLLKTDADGDCLWQRTFGGAQDDVAFAVQQTTDGGYIVVMGTTPVSVWVDAEVIRTNASGDSLWSMRLGGPRHDVFFDIQPTADGGFVFAGYAQPPEPAISDMWLVKTGPELSATQPLIPQDLRFLTNYPNPFNSATQIEFTLPATQRVSLRLYDVLGREVAVLMNEIQAAGLHRLTFDASGLPSGVYLCRLEAGEMMQTRKMVLIK